MAEPTEKEGTGNERNVKSSMNETFQKLILIRILVIKYFLFQSMKQMAISYGKKCTISNNLSGFILSLGHFVTTIPLTAEMFSFIRVLNVLCFVF